MHLQADETLAGLRAGMIIDDVAHLHPVEKHRDRRPFAYDAVVVPFTGFVILQQIGGIAQRVGLALSTIRQNHLCAPLGHQSMLMVVDVSDQFAIAGHVGLIAKHVMLRSALGADLNARVRLAADFKIAIELEVRHLCTRPD